MNTSAIYNIATIATEMMSREELISFTKETISCLTKDEISKLFDADCITVNDITTLTELINQWHLDRKIVPNSTAIVQAMKMFSEAGELADNLIKGKDVTDDIGDIYVCLCSVAKLSGLTMQECIARAYRDIKDRRGTLLSNGNFVKDV